MPPRVLPKTLILLLKTHKLTVFLTLPTTATVAELKQEVLNALQADIISATPDMSMAPLRGDTDVDMDEDDPEWAVPSVSSVDDFELCRAIRERGGAMTGRYEVLNVNDTLKSCPLNNWEMVFVRFRNENGELLPVKVSLPALDEDEEAAPEPSASSRKGKRKAPPDMEI